MTKTTIKTFMDWFETKSNAKKTLTDSNIQEINDKLKQLLDVEKELLQEVHRDGIGYQRYNRKWGNVSTDEICNNYNK